MTSLDGKDDLRYSTSGSESEQEQESDIDSITKDLNSIGRFGAAFKIASFWGYQTQENGTQTPISRREQLSNFIEDLKSGFSLQSALDRFQAIRSVLETSINEAIDNNVDFDSDEEKHANENNEQEQQDEDYEPKVITPAVEPKNIPILDQVIIPQNKEPRIHKRRRGRSNRELDDLSRASMNELNDEVFLRRRIIKIRSLSISDREQNKLIQKLMMRSHYEKIQFVDSNGDKVLEIDATDGQKNYDSLEDEEAAELNDDTDVTVSEAEKTATYHNEDLDILGCPHYQRNCKTECPRCKKWFGCPICHDEVISDHKFKRESTKRIMCMKCFNVQSPAEYCDACGIQFALYFCEKCKLYDNDESKDIYHCDGCGICRLGLGLGQDYFHCDGCNACLSIELQDDHKCIERATQSDCPICGEYMFTSIKPVVFMSCGHAIHQGCFEDFSKHSYKCPSCQKTVLNMEAQFRVLDMEISSQPLPEPYCNWRCIISCNDCNAKSSAPYHILGLKCDNCASYNTVQLKLIKPEESDYESDISTTTNQLRRGNVRDLRTIPISSSNLLNTNYNIENPVLNVQQPQQQLPPPPPGFPLQQVQEDSENGEGLRSRTLRLPQQLMNNFDNYVNNLETSSDDEDDDEQDFLRVNRSLKQRFNNSNFGINNRTDANIDEVSLTAQDGVFQNNNGGVLANAIRGLIAGTSMMINNDDDNDGDNDYDDDDDDDDEYEDEFSGMNIQIR